MSYTDGHGVTYAYSVTTSNVSGYTTDISGSIIIPTSITISNTQYSVTSIGYAAFFNCSGLTSITF